jgi:hypothetical protein
VDPWDLTNPFQEDPLYLYGLWDRIHPWDPFQSDRSYLYGLWDRIHLWDPFQWDPSYLYGLWDRIDPFGLWGLLDLYDL